MGHGEAVLRPTFDDFGTAEIAMAAQETSPYAASEPVIRPHSHGEELAAARVSRGRGRSIFTTVAATLGVLALGGGAYVAWKTWGADIIAGAPISIHEIGRAHV